MSLANSLWFQLHQRESESLVLGRIIETNIRGPDSYQGFLGWLVANDRAPKKEIIDSQYELYANSEVASVCHFRPYLQQLGGQGFFLKPVDRFMSGLMAWAEQHQIARAKFLNKVKENRIVLLQLAVAVVNAGILSLLLLWFYCERGPRVGLGLLVLTLLSPWLTVFGRNLYWMMGTWFLPCVLSAWILYFFEGRHTSWISKAWIVLATSASMVLAIFVKSTMGYEYLTTIVLAQFSFLIYYSVKWRWSVFLTLSSLFFSGMGAVAGFAASLSMHLAKLQQFYGGSRAQAISHLWNLTDKRTTGDLVKLQQEFGSQASGNPLVIVAKYVFGVWNLFPPYFLFLFPFIWLACLVLKDKNGPFREYRPLAISTLFSFLAPLSWFVLARGHSFVHFHLNYVLWHLPTMFLGQALLICWLCENYTFTFAIRKKT